MVAVRRVDLNVRPMGPEDIPQILTLENQSYSYPWTEGIFRDCMRVGYHCQVMELDQAICCYTVYSVAVGESHILNICVGRDYRRRGIGRSMLTHIIRHCAVLDVKQIYLEVRPSNLAAIKLYESMQFKSLAMRRDYYPSENGREDALILIHTLENTN